MHLIQDFECISYCSLANQYFDNVHPMPINNIKNIIEQLKIFKQ